MEEGRCSLKLWRWKEFQLVNIDFWCKENMSVVIANDAMKHYPFVIKDYYYVTSFKTEKYFLSFIFWTGDAQNLSLIVFKK